MYETQSTRTKERKLQFLIIHFFPFKEKCSSSHLSQQGQIFLFSSLQSLPMSYILVSRALSPTLKSLAPAKQNRHIVLCGSGIITCSQDHLLQNLLEACAELKYLGFPRHTQSEFLLMEHKNIYTFTPLLGIPINIKGWDILS